MHVRFACNVNLTPAYPPARHSTIPSHIVHPTQPFGRMSPHHTLGTHHGHRMTRKRLKKGPAPPMSVACPSASRPTDGSPHMSPERHCRLLYLGVPTCGPPRADDTSLTSGRIDHVTPGPPANDPSGDMDCSTMKVHVRFFRRKQERQCPQPRMLWPLRST